MLVLATTNLEMDILPALYDTLCERGDTGRLDVVFYCRGGIVSAARRIALLLHEFSSHICFIVPFYCESSGTIAALAGHEIIAGPAASFSPVDPHLNSAQEQSSEGSGAISAENVRLFADMCRDWFGMPEPEAQTQSLSVMCANVFPTTLTAFYRSMLETRDICSELLARSMRDRPEEIRSRIVDRLLFGYHSHIFSLSHHDLSALGLPVRRDARIERIAWEMVHELRQSVGAGVRRSEEDDWVGTIIATRATTRRQRYRPGSFTPQWDVGETE
ncbi:MAG TPA: hypothetical protein VHY79_09815 [Rhizomicrobium sp.]|nr:hypothetical protein [Rhizomicrobium sp.]